MFERLKNHSKTTLGLSVLSMIIGALGVGLPLVLKSGWDLSPSILAVKITLIDLGICAVLGTLASLAALFYWHFKGDMQFYEIEEDSYEEDLYNYRDDLIITYDYESIEVAKKSYEASYDKIFEQMMVISKTEQGLSGFIIENGLYGSLYDCTRALEEICRAFRNALELNWDQCWEAPTDNSTPSRIREAEAALKDIGLSKSIEARAWEEKFAETMAKINYTLPEEWYQNFPKSSDCETHNEHCSSHKMRA